MVQTPDDGEVNEAEYWETIRCACVDVTSSAEASLLAEANAATTDRTAINERWLGHRRRVAMPTKGLLSLRLEIGDIMGSFRGVGNRIALGSEFRTCRGSPEPAVVIGWDLRIESP